MLRKSTGKPRSGPRWTNLERRMLRRCESMMRRCNLAARESSTRARNRDDSLKRESAAGVRETERREE